MIPTAPLQLSAKENLFFIEIILNIPQSCLNFKVTGNSVSKDSEKIYSYN